MNLGQCPLKRVSFFLLGSLFLLFPGQNPYQIAQASYQPPQIQELAFDFPTPASYPIKINGQQAPFLTAKAAVVLDRDSGVLLYQKNPDLRLLPASTVKIMTALVALEHYDLDEVLTVPLVSYEGQDIELEEGEQITFKSLLFGLLVSSANDAALTLSQNYPGGEEAFVQAMNEKAKELNLTDTFFANPTGLDEEELLLNPSFTSAVDLARLATAALKNPVFASIVATPTISITDISGEIVHELFNINELLFQLEGVRGIKTGWTEEAGECLVAYTEREGKGVITIVLGSEDRFGETRSLIEWAFANHQWQELLPTIQD